MIVLIMMSVGVSLIRMRMIKYKMKILNCYFCDEQEEVSIFEQDDISMFFCDDCQRWQCNTEECGCVCSATNEELFDWLVDAGTSPQEIVLSGLGNLIISCKELTKQDSFYLKSMETSDEIAERIYTEAQKRV